MSSQPSEVTVACSPGRSNTVVIADSIAPAYPLPVVRYDARARERSF
jgi:hypothetical protein